MTCKTGLFLCALFASVGCFAQQNLPDSPPVLNLWSQANAPQASPAPTQQSGSSQNTTSLYLSRKDAENIALKNNPAISVAKLSALASEQVTREVKSNLWPTASPI